MQKIKSLKGKRWFVWAIVISIAALGGLAIYIYNVTQSDSNNVFGQLTRSRQIKKTTTVSKKSSIAQQCESMGYFKK
jgi:hypothetical protein